MVGKFDEYTYSNRQGVGRGRRNFYYHLDKGCIAPVYSSLSWKNLIISDSVRHNISNEQKKYLSSIGIEEDF